MAAKVTGVAEKCEPDGSHMILVMMDDGQEIEVIAPLSEVEIIIRYFQEAVTARAERDARNIVTPELTVTGFFLGHRGPRCELMVSSDRMGSLALLANDDLLRHAKKEIDRVLSFRGGSPSKH
jgi:hypothetical protein